MPQLVNLGEPYGTVSFPDEYTPEQIVSEFDSLEASRKSAPPPRASDLSVGDYARQVGGSLIRGIGNTIASVPEGIATAREAIPALFPSVVRRAVAPLSALYDPGSQIDDISRLTGGVVPDTQTALRGAGRLLRAGTTAIAPEAVPELEDSFLASRLPEGVGSAIGFAAGGAAGRLAKIPTWLSIGALGSAASGTDFYKDAIAHGADEQTANIASVIGNAVGTSEAFPLARMMKRLDGLTGNTFSKFVIEAGKDTIEEALQEGAQQLAQNFTAQQLYDKDRSLFNDIATNTGVGGATGFLMSALTQALGIPIGRSNVRRQSRDESRARIARVVAEREASLPAPSPPTQPDVVQLPSDSLTTASEVFANLPQRDAILEHGFESLNVNDQRLVMARVGSALHNGEVGNSIIQNVPVDVVNNLIGQKLPSEVPLDNKTVLGNRLSSNIQLPVGPAVGRFIEAVLSSNRIQVAQAGAERLGVGAAAGVGSEGLAASVANEGQLHNAQGELILKGVSTPGDQVVQEAIDSVFTPQPQEAPIAFVGRVVRDIVTGWQNAPDIQLVDNGGQLPQEVQAKASAEGVSINDIDAVRDAKGTVWIVADKVQNADHARRLLLHEAVGHEGVDRAFGNQQEWTTFMQGVAQRHAATPLGAEIRGLYGADPVTVGKEIVAKLAESPGADPTLWQQIVAAVRNWARRVFKVDVSDNDVRALLLRARRSLEGPVPLQEAMGGTSFALNPSGSTSVFPNRAAVQAATSNPGLTQDQVQEAEALAGAQANMVTPDMSSWLQDAPVDKVEAKAKKILKPLLDVSLMSPWPRPLSSFPEGEQGSQEQRTRELAGWSQLAHHGFHRSLAQTIASDIAAAQGNLTEAMAKTSATTHLQHKANFLTATFKRLTESMRDYLVNKRKVTRGNLQAQWDQRINRAQERVNDHEQSPTAIKQALSAIARTIPDNLLIPTITLEMGSNVDAGPIDTTAFNQPIIDWSVQNGALNTIVSDTVRDWLLTDDGTGQPALASYTELLEDLRALKDILNNEQQVNNDIDAFEAWFKNAATGTGVSAKHFAEKYFKFRTGRDSALRIIAANERDINRFDLNLRANVTARDRLASMMAEPGYNESVRQARDAADIVIRSLFDPNKPEEPPVGLIDRDRAVGTYILRGPKSGFNYVVDLHPSSAGEQQNIENLGAFIAEARAWALENATTDPLKADEFNDLAGYIQGHLMSASLNPKQGFTMTRVRIPFTNIRMPIDPFDGITALTGLGWSFQTVRDVLERMGGRAAQQAFRDAAVLDTTMRKVEAIDQHPVYGRAAQTQAVLKALESHGWDADQAKRWNKRIAEPVLAAGQNRLSPVYEVGDVIVGADTKLTAADVAALNLIKRWGDALINIAPHSIEDRLAELGITRKALGNGKWTGHRIDAEWTENFVKRWNSAPTDADKAALLTGDEEFLDVVLGYLAEYNSEFGKMNPASSDKSPLFLLYRRLADTEKAGVDTFRDWGEVVRFLANEGVNRGMFPDYVTAAQQVQTTLFDEIKAFVKAFDDNVLHYESKTVWGGIPTAVVQAISGRNAFTLPRSRLVAPSTFYSYSTATAARQQKHVGSLRSLLNLQLLQSGYEAKRAVEGKLAEMKEDIDALVKSGMSESKAIAQVEKQTRQLRALGEIRYSYREALTALQAIEKAFMEVERYEKATTEHYEHAGIAAANSFFSSIKASLLSGTQAITTNSFSGAILGPALGHWQAGQFGKAMGDIVIQPALMAKTLMKRVASMLEGNPTMSRLLRTHAPLWDDMAESVIKAAADWRRIQRIAQSTGMVNPYNLGTVLKNMGELKRTAGRFTTDEPNRLAEWVNIAMSAPGVRHATEGLKAFVPRMFDNAINYMMIVNFDREVEMVRKLGWAAFQARENAAQPGTDWKDLSKPENILTPGDFGLKTNKALEWYRQLFIPLGSLDGVLRDYYERTKTMTPEQREAEPLLSEDDHAALALQYAAKSNVSVETNRPYSLKGKGSDGFLRNVVGTFMGWGINMMHQLSKGMQTHSKDPQAPAIWNYMVGIATIVVLMASVGAWNWEFGDELTKKLYDVSSARVQLGNIKDVQTGLLYFAQALVNTVPMIGSSLGGLFGVAYTGRGNPLDMSSLSPHIGFVAGAWNTARRIVQTGDATLPLTDFTRQWVPMSKIFLNRIPTIRGLVDQQNAVRSMNASAPPGTEIKWGKRGGGDVKYSPANDEVQRLIASAYEVAAHGGDPAMVQQRLQEAIAAYVKAGRTPEDAVKALTSALGSKEPIRVLTGREMTPEEEAKWVSRMTKDQKADYDKSVAAWSILSAATGKDFNMVTTKGSGGGGTIPVRAVGLGGPALRPPGAGLAGNRIGRGIGTRRRGLPGRRRIGIAGSRRRLGPRVGGRSVTRRRIGSSSRRRYAVA